MCFIKPVLICLFLNASEIKKKRSGNSNFFDTRNINNNFVEYNMGLKGQTGAGKQYVPHICKNLQQYPLVLIL